MYKNTGANATPSGEFTNGNVGTGVARSTLEATWLNTMQREGLNLLAAADVTPDPSDFTQWTQSINILIGNAMLGFLQAAYPVGCIYFTTDTSFNPHTAFGFGTWSKMPAGKYLVTYNGSDSDFDTVRSTGGAKSCTLTDAYMPDHNHLNGVGDTAGVCFVYGSFTTDMPGTASSEMDESTNTPTHQGKTSTYGNTSPTPVPTLSPYVVLGNAWERTA